MQEFKALSDRPVNENEKGISAFWDEIRILDKSIAIRKAANPLSSMRGLPLPTGTPAFTMLFPEPSRILVCRYKTMKGYQVKRKAGWDTHGLPVEIEVEKNLNLKSKQDIEEYGIAEFNQSAGSRSSAMKENGAR